MILKNTQNSATDVWSIEKVGQNSVALQLLQDMDMYNPFGSFNLSFVRIFKRYFLQIVNLKLWSQSNL